MSIGPENPPAFPPAITVSAAGDVYYGYDGMTLRDWFAGQAIAACVHLKSRPAAERAYEIADAMLAERSK